MNWSSWSDFFAMGGYGLYVWGSLGMCAAVVAAEVALLRLRRRGLLRQDSSASPSGNPIRSMEDRLS